jgi:SpoVK/Ycf46/Vps4 family AAA+-type ATPase
LLFAGPPGCGKTLTLKALAYERNAQIVTVLGKADVEDHHVETAFRIASAQSPSIVFFEDLDKPVESKNISLSHFLNILDGFKPLNGVMVIATANKPEQLDPALLYRPSRFDRIWAFPLPVLEQRLALLQKRGGAYFTESVLREVAHKSHGFSMSYVQEIVVNALLDCALERRDPEDDILRHRLEALRRQWKSPTKPVESMDKQESVGFCCFSNGDL